MSSSSASTIPQMYLKPAYKSQAIDKLTTMLNSTIDDWFKYLRRVSPENRKHKINRFLEVYHTSEQLNFISAITRLELDEFDSVDGENRLKIALKKIKNDRKVN